MAHPIPTLNERKAVNEPTDLDLRRAEMLRAAALLRRVIDSSVPLPMSISIAPLRLSPDGDLFAPGVDAYLAGAPEALPHYQALLGGQITSTPLTHPLIHRVEHCVEDMLTGLWGGMVPFRVWTRHGYSYSPAPAPAPVAAEVTA
jgi:hypothetical protein